MIFSTSFESRSPSAIASSAKIFGLCLAVFVCGCTSLVRKPYYKFISDESDVSARVGYDGEGMSYTFKKGEGRGDHQTVWINVVNEGSEYIYAQGVILPIIPIFTLASPGKKMDFEAHLAIRVFAYANPGNVTQATPGPRIITPDGKSYSPTKTETCGGATCQIFTYELTPKQAPRFIVSETETKLDDGTVLKTPPAEFVFRDKIELIYHRGQ